MRKKIFYGWYIVAAALIFMLYNSSMFVYGFTAFVNPMAASYGWSLAEISLASSLRGMETGVSDLFIGMAADRWPAKRLIIMGLLVYLGGILLICLFSSLTMFFVGFLMVGLGSSMAISVVPITVVSRWFKKNVGKANGILAAGVAMGGLFTPLLVKGIDAFGWQQFMIYLGIGILGIGIPLAFIFRDRPQQYGMVPDGRLIIEKDQVNIQVSGMTWKAVLKTKTFWFIAISQFLQMGAMNSVAVHQIPYLTSLGMDRNQAALAVSIFAMVGIGARLLYGVLADIFPKKNLLIFSNIVTTAGLLIFNFMEGNSFLMAAVFAAVFGIGIGGSMPLRAPIVREYFGIKKFGSIFGSLSLVTTAGAIIFTTFTGWVFDVRGSYGSIWLVYAGFTLIGSVLLMLAPLPDSIKQKASAAIS